MFYGATSFNQPLDNWNTSNITTISYLFNGARNFNQDLSGWNISSISSYTDFDSGATAWDDSNKPPF